MTDQLFGKKPKAKSYYFLGKSARFISLLLVPSIAKTKIRSLHITLGSLILSLLSAFFYTFGTSPLNKIALVLFLLYFLADHIDGDLSRYKGEDSSSGEILDHVVGKVSIIFIYFGIFCGLAKTHNPVTVWSVAFILIAGFFGFQSLMTKRSLMVEKHKIHDHKFDRSKQFTKKDGILRILFKELTSVYMMSFYLIIFGSFFDKLFIAVILTAVHVWGYYACQTYTSLKFFHQIDQKNK